MSGAAGKDLNIQERTPLLGTASRFNSINMPYYLGAAVASLGCIALGGYGIYSTVTHRPIDAIKLALSIVTALAPAACTAACCAGAKPTKLPKVEPSPSIVEAGKGKSKADLTDLIEKIRRLVSDPKYLKLVPATEANAQSSSKAHLSQQIDILISLLATVDGRAEQLNTTLTETQRQLEEKARLLHEKESASVQSSPAVDLDTLKKEVVEAVLRPISTNIHLLLSDPRFQEEAKSAEQGSSEDLEAFVSRQITNLETLLESLLSSAQQSEQELIKLAAECAEKIDILEAKVQLLLYRKAPQSPALADSTVTSPAILDSTASPAIQATPSPARPSPALAADADLEALKRDVFAGISSIKLAVSSPSSRPVSRPPSAPSSPAAASPTPRTPAAVASAPPRSSGLRHEGQTES